LKYSKTFKIIILFFLFIFIFNLTAFAIIDEEINEEYYLQAKDTVAEAEIETLNVSASSILCFDRKSKRVVYEKDGYSRKKMASTTKIMTAIVTLENGDLEDEVIVSKKAASIGGSTVGLKTGDKIKLNDLLQALLIRSRK